MKKISTYKPRKKPLQKRSKASYEAVLDAAAQVLAIEGYSASTTNRIADRAGVSIGTLYEYFPSKEAVFAALIERTDQLTTNTVIENFRDMAQLPASEFLTAVLKSRIEAALAYPELESLLRSEIPAALFEEQAKNALSRFSSGMNMFAAYNSDLIRVRNLPAAIQLGSIVVESTVRTLTASTPEKLRDPEFVQEFVDLMTRYILSGD